MSFLASFLDTFPTGKAFLNEQIIDRFASCTKPRPHAFSLWGPTPPSTPAADPNPATSAAPSPAPSRSAVPRYTAWPGLVDRSFTGRHLPAREDAVSANMDSVIELVMRQGEMVPSERSSMLFCFFAQWFTDSFLRTHPLDPRRNTSNHEIDLCQVYGLDEPSTWALREQSRGRLKTRLLDGEEFPPLLYRDGALDPQFFREDAEIGLSYLRAGRAQHWTAAINRQSGDALEDPERRDFFYATGLDRGGSTVAYSAFTTIFLREHNRIAKAIEDRHDGPSGWDDNRIFETARMVNIRQLLGVVVNGYIRHIGGVFPFELDTSFAEKKSWYRTNRISIEFNLLYRWHSLIPDVFMLGDGRQVDHLGFRFNNKLLEDTGIERIVSAASAQKAGRFGLFNTPRFLEPAERAGLTWARQFGVQPFNRYRERFGLDTYGSIDELAGDDQVARALKKVYGDNVDDVEFTIGLIAERRDDDDIMPETVVRLVAHDAFTHILTNPLLSGEVHRRETFSDVGWRIIEENATLEDIVKRNVKDPDAVTVSLSA